MAGKDDTSQATWVEKQGARLVRGRGIVKEPGLVMVGEEELPYDALLVSTGSVPVIPPIEGLGCTPHWTNREATGLTEVPRRLLVVGGGPVGVEMAQAVHRLGASVALV